MQGTLHVYHPSRSLLLFEHLHPCSTSQPSQEPPPPNILLFVGGMYDNFLTPAYTTSLSTLLTHTPTWRFAHIQLSSAMRGFGISSISRDVQELSAGVAWVREHLLPSSDYSDRNHRDGGVGAGVGKVVLMGHSTGCQDLLSYLYLSNATTGPIAQRPKVDGVILQAPVSDREGAMPGPDTSMEQRGRWEECVALARGVVEEDKKGGGKKARTTILPMHLTTPLFGPVPLSVERFWSLASPGSPEAPGEDDLFSSDCDERRLGETFGVVGKEGGVLRPLGTGVRREMLVLYSGADEHVPKRVDKDGLLSRWKEAVERGGGRLFGGSQVVEGGLHDLGGDDGKGRRAREVVMRGAVARYLAAVLGQDKVEDGLDREVKRAVAEIERMDGQEIDGRTSKM